jgi:hypothetical protein
VIVCEPTASVDVVKAAPPLKFIVTVPSVVPPSVNVTVPVRVPEPGALALTFAEKVTGWPNTVEAIEVISVVVVESGFTVWLVVPVLGLKSASPL